MACTPFFLNCHNFKPVEQVIGGTAMAGGKVSVIGTVWGNALAGILISGLVIVGVVAYYQLVAIGAVLIIAVAIDQYRNRSRETW
jgi:ribose transport system permease protein